MTDAWEYHPRTGELRTEVARLHEELAKANGACADMARELHSMLDYQEEVEHQRDRLQAQCEELYLQLDQQRLINKQLMDPIVRVKMLEPGPPIVFRTCDLPPGVSVKPDAQ